MSQEQEHEQGPDGPRDLSMAQLAEITGSHVETMRRLALAGKLPGAYRLGGRWLISQAAADKLRNVPEPDDDEPAPEPEKSVDDLVR